MNKMFILGCGYLGQRVARQMQGQGREVAGVVRSQASLELLQEMGLQALCWDLDQVDFVESGHMASRSLAGASLFYFIPPPAKGVEDFRVANLIESLPLLGDPQRIVYLSTTGVYGDCHGDWVDETHPVNPVVERAKRRWDAECRFRDWSQATGGELVILRVAGIYGPGKLPLERLKKGIPMVHEHEAPYTNRIHIDDLVQVCVAAMVRGADGEVYNVSDGQPGNMTDYFNRVADQAGLPRPEQISLSEGNEKLSKGIMSYLRESRRLENKKMLDDLGVRLIHPDLDHGLTASL